MGVRAQRVRGRAITPIVVTGRGMNAQGGVVRMRKVFLAIVAAAWLSTGAGCLIPMYSADPARRAQELIFTSEDLRSFLDEWERIWFLDQPSHMTVMRTHGGII